MVGSVSLIAVPSGTAPLTPKVGGLPKIVASIGGTVSVCATVPLVSSRRQYASGESASTAFAYRELPASGGRSVSASPASGAPASSVTGSLPAPNSLHDEGAVTPTIANRAPIVNTARLPA